ncbi:citron Rho-interacting kinase-like isoform X2 [Xenia sp. Carnegie-2017]|uniref:citron Rho-interacting kinase-like isoform X2 n=1 Tax=Xenia sp. Carnegie-2017 TaxID=2897299 RepID=UPI001F0469B7|nr:citron Rho-interacting kinase-like isoform X2 [Xenia sp. Carnegie-2017]
MAQDTIFSRCAKLKRILEDNSPTDRKAMSLSEEGLIDAILAFYNECRSEYLQKDKHVAKFVQKYKEDIENISKSRPCINDFKVVSIIGRGHFGTVAVVKEIQTNKVFALKTLKKSEMLAQENVAFFEEERNIMAYSGSRWITSLQYAFQDQKNLYLVMEFHPGGDLLTLLSKQENEILDEKIARFYLAEIIMALHFLHGMGYVHRDVKPDNILIDRTGHIKLADFGSAAKLESNSKVRSRMAVGTPEYISPEVLTSLEGANDGYGVECDWWSLGVVAYEMMYGNTPFSADSVAFTYCKIMNHKESLSFPTGFKASASMKGLIRGLLTDIDSRFKHEHLVKHSFFKEINWSQLSAETPPFIPPITGQDDTSNFDEFDPEEEAPTFGGKTPMKNSFSGNDLPFVGFTFIKRNDPNKSVQRAEDGRVREIVTTDDVIADDVTLDENFCKVRIEQLQSLLKAKTSNLEKIAFEKDLLEKENILKETELKDLKKRLDEERTRTLNDDNMALKLMSEIDEMRTKARDLRKLETSEALDEQQIVVAQLEEDRFVAMKRSQHLKDELCSLQKLVGSKDKTIEELQKAVEELKKQLKELQEKAFDENHFIEMLAELKQVREFEETVSNVSPVERVKQSQRSPVAITPTSKRRVEEISTRVLDALSQYQEKERNDMTKLREEFQQKVEECRELKMQLVGNKSLKRKLESAEEDCAKAVKKNKILDEAVKKMEKEVDEVYDVGEDLKRDISKREKDFRDEVFNVNKKYEVVVLENEKLMSEVEELKRNFTNVKNEMQKVKNKNVETTKGELEQKALLNVIRIELNDSKDSKKKLEEQIAILHKQLENETILKNELEEDLQSKDSLIESLLQNEQAINATCEEDTDEIRELNEKCKTLEMKLVESSKETECLQNELKKSRLCNDECMTLQKKEKELLSKDREEIQDLKAEVVFLNAENKELKSKAKDLQSELRRINEELSEVKGQSEVYIDKLSEASNLVIGHQKTIDALKATCSMLEGQIEELEILNDELDERNIKLEIEKDQVFEKKDNELQKYKDQSEEYQKTISNMENQLARSEMNLRSLERKMEKECSSKTSLLAEVEQQKDIVLSLERELQNQKEYCDELVAESNAMAENLEILKSLHAEEKVKLVSTSAQQSKLIDFLHSKAENKSSKRKRLGVSGLKMLRKHTSERNLLSYKGSELQQSLEKERRSKSQLQLELKKVREELDETKEKVMYWKGRCQFTPNATVAPRSNQSIAVISAIQQSPSQQPSPGSTLTPSTSWKRKNSESRHRPKERMHHNIPHRFTTLMNMRATRCPVCLDSILFGRQISKCTECNIVCHTKCSLLLPRTCGLPTQYVEHFSEMLLGPVSSKSSSLGDISDVENISIVEGYLKIARNGSTRGGWDSKWVYLNDGVLNISETAPDINSSDQYDETFNLSSSDNDVKVHSAIARSDLLGVAATDLPYVFSIEIRPQTTCWPGCTLHLLSSSFPEKQRWVRALENIVRERDNDVGKSHQKVFLDVLLTMIKDERLDINTACALNDKFVLLGAAEGLFTLSILKSEDDNRPRLIPGIRKVYQINIDRDVGLALLIFGVERQLIAIDLKQLEACTKQFCEVPLNSLEFQDVGNIINCHLFASKKIGDTTFLCAAVSNKISILRYNTSMNSFVKRKEVECFEPCICIAFANDKVIIGCDKFYQIDLRHFCLTDFLHTQENTLKDGDLDYIRPESFPVDVLHLSESTEEEFLLCFNGSGVFVNGNGERTRNEDLKWSGLPLSFAYKKPYLYVTYFNSVEVCQISSLHNQCTMSRTFASIERPRILGAALRAGAVYVVSAMSDKIQIMCCQGNLSSVLNSVELNACQATSRHTIKRRRSAVGSENETPPSFSAFSKDPQRFLQSSLRH